jgi:hypothetical protein
MLVEQFSMLVSAAAVLEITQRLMAQADLVAVVEARQQTAYQITLMA